jgi:hypothetical protein
VAHVVPCPAPGAAPEPESPVRRVHRPSILPAVVLALALEGCGDGPPKAPVPIVATAEETVRARLLELFDVVTTGGGAQVAPFLAYLGADEARRYKAPATYEGDDAKGVDQIVRRIRGHFARGAPKFGSSESRTKGGERWIAWHVVFGEGLRAKATIYAFVEAGGSWLLGDID